MSSITRYEGIFSALATPMDEAGEIDYDAHLEMMEWQLSPHRFAAESDQALERAEEGVSGFVLYGTTGESATLGLSEKERLTTLAVERFPDQVLIAGVGTNSTESSMSLAQRARSWGATAGLLVTPYYNRPSQEGLYRHILSVAERVPDWPLILYVVPSRAAVTIEIGTLDRILSACPQVVAVKDASADLAYGAELVNCCEGRAVALSGDDPTALASWSIGSRGSISVVSNLLPVEMMRLWNLFESGQLSDARALFHKVHPVMRALFVETNPVPLKSALTHLNQQGLLPQIGFDGGRPTSARDALC